MTTTVRPPAVSGLFYPADPRSLAVAVDGYVAAAAPAATAAPKAMIVPHAGFVYSGSVAGTGYAAVAPFAPAIERVLLLGPAHRVAVAGVAVPSTDGFATPLGTVAVDTAARATALAVPGVVVDDLAHRDEHSLEVQLPFLQRVLGDVAVLPLVVSSTAVAAAVLEALWGGPETLVVVSSDLSHYEDYASAAAHDRATVEAIVRGDDDGIGPSDACGRAPVRALLRVARGRGLTARLLDLRNSGDTAGTKDRVVGYASVVLT
jgi:AmmeMemoRadiSam system protein B